MPSTEKVSEYLMRNGCCGAQESFACMLSNVEESRALIMYGIAWHCCLLEGAQFCTNAPFELSAVIAVCMLGIGCTTGCTVGCATGYTLLEIIEVVPRVMARKAQEARAVS